MFGTSGDFQANSVGVAYGTGMRRYDPGITAISRAASRFDGLLQRAQLKAMWAKVERRTLRLLDLDDVRRARTLEGMFDAGCVTVEVNKIRGSECRASDWDHGFLPLHEAMRHRWARVYAARLCGEPLPAVSLVQVGEIYYVRDGHHRISVARVLREQYIDANVQVWRVKGRPVTTPTMRRQLVASI